ncbi:MAG: class I SAM-dependent methyltransferase [Firmicutes bacterium]|jgi:methyltransferase (TIGR00027 family)|uniref:Methyltransferase, TIGR00027 family n=1 Tax=Melghirimyces thermohalophilus TaxID=1236220 RepID=A0A1G6LCM5_9BACL|nr:class I SAM-dependent methyltransferase [Melghirimyces thermohalophilus]MDA8353173.1 class I SAM-dependent methyltransferase [Bacillota bacterium]SDC40677.1 methyltransferase, TIGR00027 family [Melghirimyces thermohalophilus]
MGATSAISRARYTEDLLERAVRHGAKQYIILGAGMDTFAFRRPEIVEQLRVFEVDFPATQDFKRRRIAELGWEVPEALHFIPSTSHRRVLQTPSPAPPLLALMIMFSLTRFPK